MLLARTADRLYWGARYVERAEDAARIIRAYNQLVVDYPGRIRLRWEPLAVLTGSTPPAASAPDADDHDGRGDRGDRAFRPDHDDGGGEYAVLAALIADRNNPGSIVSSVTMARENLRTTREVMPREAWQAINQLSHDVDASARGAVNRQLRDQFLARVIEVSRRLDGVLESTMTRDHPYRMLRIGRLIERADMTTRVLGVAAAAFLELERSGGDEVVREQVRWMSVLRSVSALQMYQRATRGPIEGEAVVRFLLYYSAFPRSVQGCFDELRTFLNRMPPGQDVVAAVDTAEAVLADCAPVVNDGAQLDRAMERVQAAIADLDCAIHHRYVAGAS